MTAAEGVFLGINRPKCVEFFVNPSHFSIFFALFCPLKIVDAP